MNTFSINSKGNLIDLNKPKIMGILNLTPDSFSDGGCFNTTKNAIIHTEKMIKDGADIIDIGAQSTRPNAMLISSEEEIQRIGNLISTIKKEFPKILISLDTFYSNVVLFGYNEGIDLINDISGGFYDKNMFSTVAKTKLPYVLMHVKPTYQQMHEKIKYDDIILSINYYFSQKIKELNELGINNIILDPGVGFGKTQEDNIKICNEINSIGLGKYPLLVGISRKSFIYKPLQKTPLTIVSETQKLHMHLLKNGVKILRVHDVFETAETLKSFLTSH